ncbi:MAG TPA: hypothetical protein VFV19_06300 [Candidatus Polarisedimenticolaceae bacterium]|nr:hypothetical protein [Candidatus Polarisedimenticolaceae bacterium]
MADRVRPEEPFFVGYLPAPESARRRMWRTALVFIVALGGLAALVAASTGPFDRSLFEFDQVREYRGTLEAHPVPAVSIVDPGARSPFGVRRLLLVAPGKHGAATIAEAFDGAQVTLRGKRIARDGREMIEVVEGSIARASVPGVPVPAASIDDLGTWTLSGEIVDGKCFLGVMNPGRLEVHRACAIRCISGGIPPLLYARDSSGREAEVVLVSSTGAPVNREVLDLVARPVSITGRLERRDDLYYLYADPREYRRLD